MTTRNRNNRARDKGCSPPGGNADRKHGQERRDLYKEVTDKIVKQLEAGSVPWVQPWSLANACLPFGLPENGHTKNAYSGINILLLWSAAIESQRATLKWVTFKQALELGGNVRKGECGTMVVYADSFVPKAEKERAAQTGDDPSRIGFLKRYTVFNIDQCDGLPADLYESVASLPERAVMPRAERLIDATGADFRIGGDKAFYVPSRDFIQVPPQQAFFDQVNYYRTCLHELGHWTSHPSRLDRKLATRKGTKDYAREELIAEMASAFLCTALGIVPTVRHADYLASWLQVLKEDKRAIFRAASLASKAANYILKFEQPEVGTDEVAA